MNNEIKNNGNKNKNLLVAFIVSIQVIYFIWYFPMGGSFYGSSHELFYGFLMAPDILFEIDTFFPVLYIQRSRLTNKNGHKTINEIVLSAVIAISIVFASSWVAFMIGLFTSKG
jgi:hypothetical protein